MAKLCAKLCVAVLVAVAFVAPAVAFPQFWAEEFNGGNCLAVPTKGYACHKDPEVDTKTSIVVSDGGKLVKQVCAGKSYTIALAFPEARLSYLALTGGRVATLNKLNQKCPNTFVFTPAAGYQPSTSFKTTATAPASGTWLLSVASAAGSCAHFQITRASVPIAKC